MSEKKYYLIFTWGCVDPNLYGPYESYEELQKEAREVYANEGGEEHAYAWLVVGPDGVEIYSFVDDDLFSEEEEEEEQN